MIHETIISLPVAFLGITIGGVVAFVWTLVWQSALSLAIGVALNLALAEDPIDNMQPATLESFNLPTTEQGRAIQIIIGSPRVKGMNDVWHGDLRVQNIIEKVKKNTFGNHKDITVGFRYYLGFHYVFGAYAESLIQLRMGEKVLWEALGGPYADGVYTAYSSDPSFGRFLYRTSASGDYLFFDEGLNKWIIRTTKNGTIYLNNSTSITPPSTGWYSVADMYDPAPTISTPSPYNVATVSGSGTSDGIDENKTLSIDKFGIFGGDKVQGGVRGDFDLMFGLPTQGVNDYLDDVLGSSGTVPAYRGCLSIVSRQAYIGTTSGIQRMDAIFQRTTKTNRGETIWYDSKAEIVNSAGMKEMNIIHAIREVITDPDYSLGFANSVDDASFQAAADTCFTEGLGVSFVLDVSKNGLSVMNELMGYASGFIRVNPETNKFEIKLLRDDYVSGDLAIIDESVINDVTSLSRPTSSEIANQVSVTYTDPETREKATLTAQNSALIQARGVVVNKNISAPAIHDPDVANVIATRALQNIGTNPFRAELSGTKSLAQFNLGDAFKLSFADAGVESAIVRVIDIDYGSLRSGIVKMKVLQDVFGASESIFSTPPDDLYESGLEDPVDLVNRKIIELPYFAIINDILGPSGASLLDTVAGRVAIAGAKTASNSTVYDTVAKESTLTAYEENTQDTVYCAYCETDEAIPVSIDQLVIGYTGGLDIDQVIVQENSWVLVGDEIMKLVAIDTVLEELTLDRGCLDTIPQEHDAGEPVYFFSYAYATNNTKEYATGTTVDIKIIPSTTLGPLDEAGATTESLTLANRYIRPYNGANFQGAGSSNYTFTWEHRNRLTQANVIVDQSETGITPEEGTTYTFTVRDGGIDVYEETGITGTSATYTYLQRVDDFGISITGTTSPDVTGQYTESGANAGKPYYDNGTYALWYSGTSYKWYITLIAEIGTDPTISGFVRDFAIGEFAPIGTSTGAPLSFVGGNATYHLKSVRDGYESWQEWSTNYTGTPDNLITEAGDNMIAENGDNLVTEAI